MTDDPGPKGRLLRAAAELFARDGYAGVSARAVAARAGTNVAAVSYHFGGKGRLYAAAVGLACRHLDAAPEAEGVPGAAWWARLLGQELLRSGPHAAEVAAAVRRADRPAGANRLALAGLLAVATAARPDAPPEDTAAAWAALANPTRHTTGAVS